MDETSQDQGEVDKIDIDKSVDLEQQSAPKAHLPLNSEKPKRSKKPILILPIIFAIAAIGFGVWYLVLSKKDSANEPTNQASQTPVQSQDTQTSKLFAVAYAYGDSDKAGVELFWRPIGGGDRRSVKNIGQKNYPSRSGVQNNQVFVITSPGSGSSDGEVIWHSDDSGKSYEKIVSLDLPEPDQLGDQITSAAFSKDGSKLVYGYLKSKSSSNIVREIDLKSGKTTDLFTINSNGVFIKGYDTEKKAVYYSVGCYNCDGSGDNKLFAMNLGTKQETLMYEIEGLGMRQVFSSDYGKLLVLEGSQSTEGIGGGPPYKVREFDMSAKTFKDLLTIEKSEIVPEVGYRLSDDVPYFSESNSVYSLSSDGTRTKLFEATKPVYRVLCVGKDNVVVASGTFDDYVLNNFTISSSKTVEILKGDQSTVLFGVTLE